jgi:O-acetylserine/cysteine efflux transporter
VLTLCAAACWGLGNVINRQIGLRYRTSLPSLVAWGGLVPILPFFALSWLFEGPELIASSLLNIRWQGVLCVLYLSFIATWLGYGLWGRLLMRYPLAEGMVAAALLLDEHPTPLQWLGSGLVLLGFVVHLLGGKMRFLKTQTED